MGNQKSKKNFVGFGFGAVQAGLMLFEAIQSGNFSRYSIIEIDSELVQSIKNNHGVMINTATKDGIIASRISGFEIYNPKNLSDLPFIAQTIRDADELATAIPSVAFYGAGENSIVSLLVQNINPNKPQIIYTAENNNYAAEILTEKIGQQITNQERLSNFQALNTVIGKMGGIIEERKTIGEMNLEVIVPGSNRAILVEEFNRIIVSKVQVPGTKKGITVFQEKDDLLPFEEAKLFGHNAVHSLLGYFAARKGYQVMSQIRQDKELFDLGKQAFKNECGAFLLKKYSHLDDPLFTLDGFQYYGDDLLLRMTNPFLNDKVSRICRDPERKLGYHDRFYGTMREALRLGITPTIMAKGAAAAISYLVSMKKSSLAVESIVAFEDIKKLLTSIWKDEKMDRFRDHCIQLTWQAYQELPKYDFIS